MCFSRRKRKKIDNMVVNIIKIYLKMKKKKLFEYRADITK